MGAGALGTPLEAKGKGEERGEKKRKSGRNGGDGRRRRKPLFSKQGRLYIFIGYRTNDRL